MRINGGEVCIPVYANDAAILFEDAYGNRYADPDMKTVLLMYREELAAVCRQKVPEQLMLMIKESDDFYTKPFANQENLQLAKQLLEKAEVTRSFKHVLTERMVEYCYFHEEQTRELDAWLVSLNPGELTKKDTRLSD